MTIEQLEELAKEAAPGPWMLQDSCSWRRIGTDPGTCGDVLCPVVRSDGQPDIEAPRGTLEYIAAMSPDVAIELIRDNKSRRNMLDMVINSVAGALERAGVKDVDDPGEAIDVLVADKDKEIVRLRTALERIAKYPLLREEELTAGGCRVIAQDALNHAALATTGHNDGR